MRRIPRPFWFLALALGASLCAATAQAQSEKFRECGNEVRPDQVPALLRDELALRRKPTLQLDAVNYCVPIKAHIVRKSDHTGGMPISQLNQGMTDLNNAYASMNISFHLLATIDYIDSDDYYFNIDTDAEIDALKGVNPVANAINCYFTPNLVDELGGLCGLSSFTSDAVQGIAFDNSCVGLASNPSTFPHEVGHYFDLYHTHETAFGAERVDGSNCTTAGDKLCDTPADPGLTGRVDGNCNYTTPGLTDSHGDHYAPDTHQLMSYSQKTCRDVFSPQSKTKIVLVLTTLRSNHLNCPPTANAGPDQTVECASNTTTAVTLNGSGSSDPDGPVTYDWSAPGVTFDDSHSATPTGQFPKGTTVVTLTVDQAGAEDTATMTVHVVDTTPPSLSCPSNAVVECSGHCSGGGVPKSDAQLLGFFAGATATDACDASPVVTNDAPNCFPVGTTTVTFTATDDAGRQSTCQRTVKVEDTTPPVITCPADITVECNDHCAGGGVPATDPAIAAFLGGASATDVCDPSPTLGNNAPTCFTVGTTTVTFTATDDATNSSSCTAKVHVVDTTPPTIVVSNLNRDVLWPPNHKLSQITCTVAVADICDPNPVCRLVSITSNEPDNGLGDGDTANDIQNATFGTCDTDFLLRSERSGTGSGRTYTVRYSATDASGNVAYASFVVRVPHDQSGGHALVANFNGASQAGPNDLIMVLPGGQDFDPARIDAAHVYLGNTLGAIAPSGWRLLDADSDVNRDLELVYPGLGVSELKTVSQNVEPVGVHFTGDGVDYSILDLFATAEAFEPVQPVGPGGIGVVSGAAQRAASPDEPRAPSAPVVATERIDRTALDAKMNLSLATPGRVRVEIYSITGQRVGVPVDAMFGVGRHPLVWNGLNAAGRSMPSGIYVFRVQAPGFQAARKFTLLR